MEGPSSSYDSHPEYIPPAESATAIESYLETEELVVIDYMRFGYRSAGRKGADPARKKAFRNSYAQSQTEIIRVAEFWTGANGRQIHQT